MASALLCLVLAVAGALAGPLDLIPEPASIEIAPRAELADYRLNENFWPSHYDIQLTPYFEDEGTHRAFTFDGTVVITLRTALSGLTSISLHAANMDIVSVSLKQVNTDIPVQLGDWNVDTEILTVTVTSGQALTPNVDYTLIFNYVGRLENDMKGFYRSYYYVEGKPVWMASTQFQTTFARRAFPCFDEPKFKATYTLAIVRLNGHRTFSNTPIRQSTNIGGGRTMDQFEKTPIMSSYLVAFIVADYIVNEREGMGILARPEALNQTDYSLQAGIDILAAIETWLDYRYSSVPEMTRMYMAAIPDFSAGAMENWGLLTYRETNILYRSDDSTSLQQQRIAAVIAHEIAHMWFGDLVTCEWWDVTWLNEGFARYFQYFGTAYVETNWGLEHQFVVEQVQGAMQSDSLESTHPMTYDVYTQSQVSSIFDSISYNKGAAVLRMVEHIMTTEKFRDALRAYLKKQAYKTSRPSDLFQSLEAVHANITYFMEPWTTQSGYPLVTVTASNDGYSLTQQRFLLNNMAHNDQTLWPIAITYASKAADFDNTEPAAIMTEQTHKIIVDNSSELPYFILNNQQVGYYRVNYDADSWAKISAALRSENFGGIHVLNRAQIVDDLLNLARADIVKYDVALDILEYLKDETEYAPWLAAVNGLTVLSRRIHVEDDAMFAKYIVNLFSKAYDLVKFEAPANDEDRMRTYLRINVLQWACNYGHADCKKAAVDEFNRYYENPSVKVHPDLRQIVYCEGIRQGTEKHFEFLWKEYLTTNMATEQILILQGIGCAQDRELVFTVMDAITSDDIRPQDKSTAFAYLLNNAYTHNHLSEYLRTYYVRWVNAHGSYMSVASALNNLLARAKTDEQMWRIRSFAYRNEEVFGAAAYASIERGIEEYEANKEFTEKHRAVIGGFLEAKLKDESGGASAITVSIVTVLVALLVAMMR